AVRRLRACRERLEPLAHRVARRFLADQNIHACGIPGRAAGRRRKLFGVRLELLVVLRLAADACDDQVVELRMRLRRREQCRERGGGDARAHSRPQKSRNSHSPPFSASSSRKKIGMFQRSSTWRSTMPASEKRTASGSAAKPPSVK